MGSVNTGIDQEILAPELVTIAIIILEGGDGGPTCIAIKYFHIIILLSLGRG